MVIFTFSTDHITTSVAHIFQMELMEMAQDKVKPGMWMGLEAVPNKYNK